MRRQAPSGHLAPHGMSLLCREAIPVICRIDWLYTGMSRVELLFCRKGGSGLRRFRLKIILLCFASQKTSIIASLPRGCYSLTVAICNSLIDQLLQRFSLFWGGYRSDNRFTNNIAVLVNYVCCRIGEQPGCEFSCLTV